jgi:hypothetical protein
MNNNAISIYNIGLPHIQDVYMYIVYAAAANVSCVCKKSANKATYIRRLGDECTGVLRCTYMSFAAMDIVCSSYGYCKCSNEDFGVNSNLHCRCMVGEHT